MREIRGNFWDFPADAYVVTTNGTVRKDGAAVMGLGVALQAKRRFRGIEYGLGDMLTRYGNIVQIIWNEPGAFDIIAFPVKHDWRKRASIPLIKQSLKQLTVLSLRVGYDSVAMVRPGCGSGGLDWRVVGPILHNRLNDSFFVVEHARR